MKKLFVLLAMALSGSGVFADYLFFQVAADNANNNLYYGSDGKYYFNGKLVVGANIKATADGGKSSTSLGVWYGGEIDNPDAYFEGGTATDPTLLVSEGDFVPMAEVPSGGMFNALVDLGELGSNPGSYSYYIELIGYDSVAFGGTTGVVGVGDTFTYSDLTAGNFIQGDIGLAGTQIWTGGAYNVPEPSGALLMLMGLALAGLKRRKV